MKKQIKSDALLNAFEQFQLTEKEMNETKGGVPDYLNVYYCSATGTVGFHYEDGNLTHYTLNGQNLGADALMSYNDNTSLGDVLVLP